MTSINQSFKHSSKDIKCEPITWWRCSNRTMARNATAACCLMLASRASMDGGSGASGVDTMAARAGGSDSLPVGVPESQQRTPVIHHTELGYHTALSSTDSSKTGGENSCPPGLLSLKNEDPRPRTAAQTQCDPSDHTTYQ